MFEKINPHLLATRHIYSNKNNNKEMKYATTKITKKKGTLEKLIAYEDDIVQQNKNKNKIHQKLIKIDK